MRKHEASQIERKMVKFTNTKMLQKKKKWDPEQRINEWMNIEHIQTLTHTHII